MLCWVFAFYVNLLQHEARRLQWYPPFPPEYFHLLVSGVLGEKIKTKIWICNDFYIFAGGAGNGKRKYYDIKAGHTMNVLFKFLSTWEKFMNTVPYII